MKRFMILLIVSVSFFSCKKAIQQAQENAILNAMTDGQWIVTSFINNGTDITSDFSAYKFQYFRDYTVNAIKNGTVDNTGTWQADPTAMNITGNFPSATNPLLLINGVWHITDNSWTYVKATMTIGSETRTLKLEKQ